MLALVGLAAAALLIGSGANGASRGAERAAASAWRGLVGGPRPQIAVAQRMLVVLRAPSLAERVAAAGGRVGDQDERRWTATALAAQRQLLSKLATHGIFARPEFSYARVLNGFSAPLDTRGVALLERSKDVAGVYPVRAAYPALSSFELLEGADYGAGTGHRAEVVLPGYDGRGVTIALLDTGIDRAHPYLGGLVQEGVDVVSADGSAAAEAKPDDPAEVETHGTEVAGLLVGRGGPGGLGGVAPSATLMPIRVAGWQPDVTCAYAVYARTDQLIAGLERAVDPNGDGDAHDAARIALIPLAEPYGGFADGPAARAVAGATALDTLVVAPAGNDGPAGPDFGSLSGPGGSPAALTVGAADLRPRVDAVRVVARTGLRVELDRLLPLGAAAAPAEPLHLSLVAPGAPAAEPHARSPRQPFTAAKDFFDARGFSLVAGRAVLVAAAGSVGAVVAAAAQAGAAAIVLAGGTLPAGGLGFDETVDVPVVAVPESVARSLRSALAAGKEVVVSIGTRHSTANPGFGRVAPFSSRGLAFDGRVKPDLVAAGVGLLTADPGSADDGTPRLGTVNGSSAAAAIVAGAAALLAQDRPDLDALELKSLLAGTARPLAQPATATGAGLLDLSAAAAAEFAADPTALAFGRATKAGWTSSRVLVLRNVSTRPLRLALSAHASGPAAAVQLSASPLKLTLRRGATARVRVVATVRSLPKASSAQGMLRIEGAGTVALRVPWSVSFGEATQGLVAGLALSARSFEPSDTAPAVLYLRAGRLIHGPDRDDVRPLARLDVQLWTAGGKQLGVLARLRDVLPGRLAIALTGRGPAGSLLHPGRYRLRLLAIPTGGGAVGRASIGFSIR